VNEHERTIEAHSMTVYAALWDAKGERLLSCSSDHTIKLWDAESGPCCTGFPHEWSISWHLRQRRRRSLRGWGR